MNALRMWMLLLGVLLASTATIGSCVCVAQAVEASDKFAETFAIGKGGRPLTVPVSYQGRRLLFLLDTGAAKTCFDKFFESRLGVSSGTSSFKAPAGVRSIELYSCPDATLGRFSLSPVDTVACVDLQTIRYVTGLPIDGILGSDFCAGKILDVDFDNGRLAIHTSGSLDLEDDVSAVMLPIAMEHGVPHVTVTLPQDLQTRFAVDTGANRTSLRSELFRELVSSKDIDVLGSHSTASIAGNAESRIGRLRKMGLGRHQLTDVVLDRDDLNLLALDHLARFRVRLDLIGGRLVLQKGKRFRKPAPNASSGMSIITHDGKKIVVAVKANGPALRAGMQRGDELITVAGKDASAIDMFELRQTLTYKPGREIVIEVRRGTSTRSIAVELAEINAF